MFQLKECTIQELKPNMAEEIEKFVSKDEQVLLCYEWTNIDGFFPKLRNYAVEIITEKQLLQAGLMLGNFDNGRVVLDTQPVDKIHSISQKRLSSLEGYIVIVNSDEIHFNENREAADHFVAVLEQAVKDAKVKDFKTLAQLEPSSKQIADQLIKLIDLRQKNLITEDEFNSAKRKLLE